MKGVELCDSLPECLKTYENTKSDTLALQKSGKLCKSYFLSFARVSSLHSICCNNLIRFSLLIKCIFSAQINIRCWLTTPLTTLPSAHLDNLFIYHWFFALIIIPAEGWVQQCTTDHPAYHTSIHLGLETQLKRATHGFCQNITVFFPASSYIYYTIYNILDELCL